MLSLHFRRDHVVILYVTAYDAVLPVARMRNKPRLRWKSKNETMTYSIEWLVYARAKGVDCFLFRFVPFRIASLPKSPARQYEPSFSK